MWRDKVYLLHAFPAIHQLDSVINHLLQPQFPAFSVATRWLETRWIDD